MYPLINIDTKYYYSDWRELSQCVTQKVGTFFFANCVLFLFLGQIFVTPLSPQTNEWRSD